MTKPLKTSAYWGRFATAITVVYVALWAWLIVDRWTGSLGFLHRSERVEVRFWLAVVGAMMCTGWIVWQVVARRVGVPVRLLWGLPIVVIVAALAGIFLPGPPFDWSREELEAVAADVARGSTSELQVLDLGPGTTRIGSYDFVRIRAYSGEEIVFEEKYPEYNWTGRGLVYSPSGEPTHLRDNYEYLELESQGGGWYRYFGSL